MQVFFYAKIDNTHYHITIHIIIRILRPVFIFEKSHISNISLVIDRTDYEPKPILIFMDSQIKLF